MDIFLKSIWHPLGNSEDGSQEQSSLTCIMQGVRLDFEWLIHNPVLKKTKTKQVKVPFGLNWLKRNISITVQ